MFSLNKKYLRYIMDFHILQSMHKLVLTLWRKINILFYSTILHPNILQNYQCGWNNKCSINIEPLQATLYAHQYEPNTK